jgi:hypothetical protein
MRSIKLTAATAAAAALLTLAPAFASAAGRHQGRHTGGHAESCRVNLSVAPSLIAAGGKVTATGHLTCAPASAEGNQTVTLYQGSLLTPGYSAVGSATTESGATGNGDFKIEDETPVTANSRFYAVADGAQSADRAVKVEAEVTLEGPAESRQLLAGLRDGHRSEVLFKGTVSPANSGAQVVLQRQDALTGNTWHIIGSSQVIVPAGSSVGTFSIVHRFLVPGDANIRVVVRSQHRNIPSPSNILTYEISQAQRTALTINSSADPIAFGQPVTISGTLAGGSNASVTLLSRTVHQQGFAPVAQAEASSTGAYVFPAQSPIYSTLYEVQGNGRTSAVLYQAVRDVLTVVPPGPSAQVGQTLSFSGTVTPERVGHVIYLEQQDPIGTGFHVVRVSTITAGPSGSSVYTIEHTVYEAGTSTFQVRIPGDAQNGGAVSQPFTIQVAPASSATAITPEAPGNSSLPAEGQV